jgi:hypothetical protein
MYARVLLVILVSLVAMGCSRSNAPKPSGDAPVAPKTVDSEAKGGRKITLPSSDP